MSLPYRPESFLLKLAILWVHLINIVQAPPLLGLSILYGRQVSTYGTTPKPRMTLWLSLSLVYSLDSPGSCSHALVVPRYSTAWLNLFPYKRLRRSTSEISKGNVLGYDRNLGSLGAARLGCFLRRNLICGGRAADYIARCPSYFGGLWRAA